MSCYPLQVVSRMVMNRSGEVFYIGGNDVLPAPLEPKREAFILQKLGTGQEEEAKSVLIEHNLRLVVYIAKTNHLHLPAQHGCYGLHSNRPSSGQPDRCVQS